MTKSKIQNKSKIQIPKYKTRVLLFVICALAFICHLCFGIWHFSYAQEKKPQPIIVNGDTVEYSADSKEVTATGNVEVVYKGVKLTCQKLNVNSQTKVGIAEGNARLEDEKGVIEGSKIIYNFEAKTGTMIDSEFRANPYFGKAREVEKVSDIEFIALKGYATTCSLDHPHYRIGSEKINMFPKDKIQTKGDTVYAGDTPLFYLPQYNHSLKDPLMHVQFTQGSSKYWGQFLLNAWRYNLTEYINGRIYLDYRTNLGVAEGFGANYAPPGFGKGDFKFYYTQERDHNLDKTNRQPRVFERYLIRNRYKWDIDEQTNVVSEYYKIVDSKRFVVGPQYNFLQDYFTREYEKDSQPLSYVLLHHGFNYSSMDVLVQPRTNRWYTQLEKLPEIKYSFPNMQIGESPFYFENASSAANFTFKHAVPSPSTDDINVIRFDTGNKFSLPMKVAFFQVTPFVKSEQTYYDKNIYGASTVLRNIFYSGADVSTKFYRILNVKSNFLGMDINGLRHIITPTVGYAFNHEPTVIISKLKQIDTIDAITRSNSAALGLSNKLQTKRKGQSVDLVDFLVTNSYNFKPKTGDKRGSSLSDFIFELKILPYSWMSFNTDATYKHSGSRSDTNYNRFTNVNYDINFNLGSGHSFGLGQRYNRKGSNEITYGLDWRINPKWMFSVYERYERGHDPTLSRGLREQQYIISRDLHCWTIDITYNEKRGSGNTIWLVFRLKAFPELEFTLDQSYHQPKPGSQSNP